jgi:hypothetical protein
MSYRFGHTGPDQTAPLIQGTRAALASSRFEAVQANPGHRSVSIAPRSQNNPRVCL